MITRQAINTIPLNHLLFLLLVIMNVIDFETTYIGIEVFGKTEMNPVMATAIGWAGTVWAVLWVKAIVFGHLYYHYFHTAKGKQLWHLKRTTVALVIFNILFLAVVTNNLLRTLW